MIRLDTEQSSMFQISSQDKYTHLHKGLQYNLPLKKLTFINLNTTQFQTYRSTCLGSENIGQIYIYGL